MKRNLNFKKKSIEKKGVVYLAPWFLVNNPEKQRQNKDEEKKGEK
jgi:hypothetical protein